MFTAFFLETLSYKAIEAIKIDYYMNYLLSRNVVTTGSRISSGPCSVLLMCQKNLGRWLVADGCAKSGLARWLQLLEEDGLTH